jgi:hypothetical protein
MREFQGNSFQYEISVYKKVIFPLVWLKVFFASLFQSIRQVIWAELIQGKKIENEITNLILFGVFCILSLVTYYLQNYTQVILISFVLIWMFDYFFATNQYNNLEESPTISLKQIKDSDEFHYQMDLINHHPVKIKFIEGEIKQIYILPTEITGGAFEETMGIVWQCFLLLYNDKILLINEAKNPHEILNQAKEFKTIFNLNIPIIFKYSEGNNPYSEANLPNSLIKPTKTIRCQVNERKYHIYSQWNLENSWLLLKQVFSESGFFLFVLIMAGFMIKFGGWVNFFVANYLGFEIPVLVVYNLGEWFDPQWQTLDLLEFAIAILIIIVKGWEVSKEKHFYIDKYYLKFFINNKKIAQLKTKEIETVLLLNKPQLSLLILDTEQGLQITELQQKIQFSTLLLKLEEGLSYFQKQNS